MDLLNRFTNYISTENLFHPKDKLILAVSGGVDSIVLSELCKQANFDFFIAHCNFQLRSEESERDEQFVRALADNYGVEIFIKKFNTKEYAKENGGSIQVAARELRYSWFEKLADQHHAFIVTAHHADDNIETLLMNFFKGTGINGLKAMSAKNGKIIRPLLFAEKSELLEFALTNSLQFVEDSSNAEDKYTRNYFRNQIIPSIAKVYPQVENNLANNIRRFSEIDMLYRQAIDLHSKKLVEQKGSEVHIPVLKLQKAMPLATILYEILKAYSFSPAQTDEVISLLNSSSGKYVGSPTHKIIKNRNWLIITPNNTEIAENVLIEEETTSVLFDGGELSIKKSIVKEGFKPPTESTIACLDSSLVNFPLLLRKWKKGDYFYPLGMNKKKKLSRFFIDQKMSIAEKEKAWVVEMDKKIVWVVGRRIDDRFKITPSTKEVLQIFCH